MRDHFFHGPVLPTKFVARNTKRQKLEPSSRVQCEYSAGFCSTCLPKTKRKHVMDRFLQPVKAFPLQASLTTRLQQNGFRTPCTNGVFKRLHIEVDHMNFSSRRGDEGQREGGADN